MSQWADAHCHLQEQFLKDDRESRVTLAETLQRAYEGGVDRVVVVGTDAVTSQQGVDMVSVDSDVVEVFATVGLHPHDAEQGVGPVAALARQEHPRVVGIGECGLDYFYEHAPREQQQVAFREQIRLAHELDLALVIHARDAWDDLYEILSSEGVPPRTVIHCFTGGEPEARACLDLGCDISFSGIITFKNAESLREAARMVPLERLHVETDSPFLAPVPYRGKANEPALVRVVGEALAEIRGEPVETIRRESVANTSRLFNLPVPPG